MGRNVYPIIIFTTVLVEALPLKPFLLRHHIQIKFLQNYSVILSIPDPYFFRMGTRHQTKKIRTIFVAQRKPSHATTKSMLFTVCKDENTKEDSGTSLKNALNVLRYAKKHLLG